MGEGLKRLPEVLHGALAKAISIQQSPAAVYVAKLRRARPDANPAEIIAVLEKRYLAAVTSTGAAVGAAAAAPGVGTGLAVALGGSETAVFLEATALFALSVTEVHGLYVREVERRRTLVMAVVLGDHGVMFVEKIAGRTGQHWADLLPDTLPISSIASINKTLGHWFLTKYGRKQAVLAIGRVAPFGIGATVGGAGNRAFGRVVINTSRRVFGPAPASFVDPAAITIIDGRTNGSSATTAVHDFSCA
jgi:hypothetical protein